MHQILWHLLQIQLAVNLGATSQTCNENGTGRTIAIATATAPWLRASRYFRDPALQSDISLCRYFRISLVIPRRPELYSSIKMQQKFEEEMPRLAEAVRSANQDINKQSQTFAELDDCLRIRSLIT
jgi:hypothetical protein